MMEVKETKEPKATVSVDFLEFCDLLALVGRVSATVEYIKEKGSLVDGNTLLKMLGYQELQEEKESE